LESSIKNFKMSPLEIFFGAFWIATGFFTILGLVFWAWDFFKKK